MSSEAIVILGGSVASMFFLVALSQMTKQNISYDSKFFETGSLIVLVVSCIGAYTFKVLEGDPVLIAILANAFFIFAGSWLGFGIYYCIGGCKWYEVKTEYSHQCLKYNVNINSFDEGAYVVTINPISGDVCTKYRMTLNKVVNDVDLYGSFNILTPVVSKESYNLFTEKEVRDCVRRYMESVSTFTVSDDKTVSKVKHDPNIIVLHPANKED